MVVSVPCALARACARVHVPPPSCCLAVTARARASTFVRANTRVLHREIEQLQAAAARRIQEARRENDLISADADAAIRRNREVLLRRSYWSRGSLSAPRVSPPGSPSSRRDASPFWAAHSTPMASQQRPGMALSSPEEHRNGASFAADGHGLSYTTPEGGRGRQSHGVTPGEYVASRRQRDAMHLSASPPAGDAGPLSAPSARSQSLSVALPRSGHEGEALGEAGWGLEFGGGSEAHTMEWGQGDWDAEWGIAGPSVEM